DAAAASWDQFVEGAATATFFHRAAWKTVLERSFGHRAYFLYAEHDGVIEGVLPLVHISSRLFGNFLVSTAFGVYGGPAAASPAQALNRRALEIADRLDVSHVEYRSESSTQPGWAVKKEVYATFRRPIGEDPDRNLSAVPRKQRAVIRKSLSAGLTASIDDDM